MMDLCRGAWSLLFVMLLLPAFTLHSKEADAPKVAPVAAKAAKEETPAQPAAPATPTAPPTDAAPTLPPYMTGANPDERKPLYPDATGANAGVWIAPAGDGKADIPSKMTNEDLYARIAHNHYSINMVWILICGAFVMFMNAGFAMVETGLTRHKNAAHTMAMNFMIYPLCCLAFWAYGFAIGWGNWWNGPVGDGWSASLGPGLSVLNEGVGLGLQAPGVYTYGIMGMKGFFLNGVDDVSVMGLFFFMMVFMHTTATISTGAMAERWAWKNFMLYCFWVALPYCLYANWVWGGGWLAQSGKNWGLGHGAVDFAGSGVVHSMGGAIAIAGVLAIGPRMGKFVNGIPQPMPGHNVPLVVIGTLILAFGWFGFNPGSTLAGTDLRISVVTVNTLLASVAGAFATMLTLMAKGLKPDPTFCCNGLLAGLVAITAPCAFVGSTAAVAIGAVAGFIVVLSVFFVEERGIDDPVGAISVHGVNGIWGVLSLGLFANGKYGSALNGVNRQAYIDVYGSDGVRGLFYGDPSQFFAQLLSAGTVLVFGFCMAFVWFKFANMITPMRVSEEVEIEGLDVPETGVQAYPEMATR